MDMSGTSWISEMGLEDPNLSEQYDILDFFDEELSAAIANIGDDQEDMQNSWSQEFNSTSINNNTLLMPRTDSTTSLCTSSFFLDAQNIASSAIEETPFAPSTSAPQYCHINFNNNLNTENITNNNVVLAPSPSVLVFGNCNNKGPETNVAQEVLISSSASYVNLEELAAKKAQSTTTKKTTRTRPPSQTYDHIIAERKRREQLSQQFVALSSIVPGLKKMDKTSVLGDAINYLKQLQERVNTLEEKASKQKMESMVLVKKTQLMIEDDDSNSDDQGSYDEQHLPEIEAKLCDKKVLLRIQCEKNTGLLGKIFSVIQKLNMAVINTNVTPFGNMAVDITIVAEMDKELKLTMKELVKSLRSALLLE